MRHIEKSITLKKELDSLRPLKKEDEQRIMQKFRLDWNYHSNNLEGNTLTYGETKALILFGITAQGKPLKDHFEVTGHDEAIKWVMERVKQKRPLNETFIRELHTLILKEPYKVDAITPDGQAIQKTVNVGKYKTEPNHVRTKTGEIFRFATPEETPAKMYDLLNWYRDKVSREDTNPILLAAEFHYKYIRIHPFDDGNGRTARILMNLILMQFGYPPVIIKTDDKENYFATLRQADAGLLDPFIAYISEQLNNALEIMIKGAKGESIEEPDDLDKEISVLKQKFKNLSQPINIAKSKEHILEVFNKSICPLTEIFIEKARKFQEFYVENTFYIWVNNGSNASTKEIANIIDSARECIKENTHSIRSEFCYTAFNQKGFQESNFRSSIAFKFHHTGYEVFDVKKHVVFNKLYSEQLEEKEIIELVNAEGKRHKNYIEKQISEIKKS